MKKVGLFLGTNRGYNVLSELIKSGANISSVLILSQDKHEYENYTSKIISICKKYKIFYKTSSEIKPKNYKNFLELSKPDVLFVISWRFLIPKECFRIPKKGIYVVHDSLLPKYRGFSPTNWVIINGEKKTGLTLQLISEAMDEGDIVKQIKVKLSPTENARTLNEKFLKLYPKIILDTIDAIFKNTTKPKPQNNSISTYGCKRTPVDGKIDFSQKTKKILQLIRGLTYPYPGAFCYYRNRKVIIWDARLPKHKPYYAGRIPGKIVNRKQGSVNVLTNDGIISITSASFADNNFENQDPSRIFNSISHTLS